MGGSKSIGAEKLEGMGFLYQMVAVNDPRDLLHVPTFASLEFNQSCDPR
jgi:hypothetical protein